MAIKTSENIQFFGKQVEVTVWIKSHRDHWPYTLIYPDAATCDARLDQDIAELCDLEDLRAKCQDELDKGQHRAEKKHGIFRSTPADRRAVIHPIRITNDQHHNPKHRIMLFLANEIVDDNDKDFTDNLPVEDRFVGHDHGKLEYTSGNEGDIQYHVAALQKKAKDRAESLDIKKLLWKRGKKSQMMPDTVNIREELPTGNSGD